MLQFLGRNMRPVYIDVAGRRLPVPVATGLGAAGHNRSSLTETPSDNGVYEYGDDDGDNDDGDDYKDYEYGDDDDD